MVTGQVSCSLNSATPKQYANMGGVQVPVKEREKLLKKEGLDPTRLANLTLVYKVQEVALRWHENVLTCLNKITT